MKVKLCHKDKTTISVGEPAQRAHVRHGDALGECDATGARGPGGGAPEAVGETDSRGGPPEGKGRPKGSSKPEDAGKKPGEPQRQGRGNGSG